MTAMHPQLAEWVWQPVLPTLQVAAIGVVLAGLAVAAYARSARQRPVAAGVLGAMRLMAIVLLVGLLMGPSVAEEGEQREQRPVLGVLVDTSASMQRPPHPHHRSSADWAADEAGDAPDATRFGYLAEHWLNEQQLAALQERFDVRLMRFDHAARTLSPDLLQQPAAQAATGSVTRYADALTTALLDVDRAAREDHAELLLLGDGHDSDDATLGPAAAFARERGVPIHAVAVGSEDVPPNVAVVALPRQDYLLLEEEGQLIVQVHQGGLDDATVTLNVAADGMETIEREVSFDGRRSVTVDVPTEHDEPGLHAYDAWVEPIAGEVETADNRHRAFVEVLERGMRVLVLEGEPYWDTKFLAQSLRKDARMEITQITQVSVRRREGIVTRTGEEATVPTNVDEFAAYDVVILGRQIERMLDEQALTALRDWVLDRGGQVVLARGRPYATTSNAGRAAAEILGQIEPVRWHGELVRHVPVSLTAAGRSSPLFSMAGLTAEVDEAFAALPAMRVIYAVEAVKPAAIVLARIGPGQRVGQSADAESRSAPAMVEMNVGSGRVLAVLGEGLWQWRLLPPTLAEYEGVFDAFWSNAVRYLAAGGEFRPGEDVTLQLGRSIVQAGDPLTIDVVLRHVPPEDFAPVVTLTGPDGETRQVEPTLRSGMRNRLRATVHPEQVGVWRASLSVEEPLRPTQQERPFSVYRVDYERLRSEARPTVLRDLAEHTGGLFFDATERVDLARQLDRRLTSQQTPPSVSQAWDSGWLLALLVMWLGLEWVARRRAGWL